MTKYNVTLTRGKILSWNIPRTLFLISYSIPFVGIVVNPIVVWPVTFAVVIAWILLSKYEVRGALAMLWGVQVEPAPCDILRPLQKLEILPSSPV